MATEQAENLSFYFFNPRDFSPHLNSIINTTYSFWNDIWFRALKQIEPIERLHSDDFMRCDHVGVLYHQLENKPILLCFYTAHDLNLLQTFDDSYFKAWPKEILHDLKRQGINKVLVCSHWTLGREQRLASAIDMKHLVLGLIHCVFQNSSYPVLLTTSRNSKKVNQLLSFMGCHAVATNIMFHGEPADMFTLSKEQSIENFNNSYPKELRQIAMSLWTNRNPNNQKLKIAV